ncbi:hypothetical protein [Halococcus sp. PRR34]|uniref:hypothetical protein n=1 Tax=Halococcus sp. PRR34 TaxID=3020830 RepID=UPI002361DED5|nr:hypothetical protein [Halococcus sp. PRR34]
MDTSAPPPDATEIMALVRDALGDIELEPAEKREIWSFVQRELPYLRSQRTSYFILGSYRDPYLRRLRIVQHELTKRVGAYPFVLGDLDEISTDRLPMFDVMFTLLAAYTDYIVGVYEKESGGEAPELGEIDDAPYFAKTHVLPRDYTWFAESNIASRTNLLDAALRIHFRDDLEDHEKQDELDALLTRAQEVGVSVTDQEIEDAIQEREDDGTEPTTYSWVHTNKFRLFELHDRCYPWTTENDLRTAVENLPSPTPRPTWEK